MLCMSISLNGYSSQLFQFGTHPLPQVLIFQTGKNVALKVGESQKVSPWLAFENLCLPKYSKQHENIFPQVGVMMGATCACHLQLFVRCVHHRLQHTNRSADPVSLGPCFSGRPLGNCSSALGADPEECFFLYHPFHSRICSISSCVQAEVIRLR